jgi:hypothetical protein
MIRQQKAGDSYLPNKMRAGKCKIERVKTKKGEVRSWVDFAA